ncbi:MAG: glycosyltransferase family 2 protein [Acidovorax sp.]|uniref:glycosyltransferase family 2 protein n=1 Tax=Acidovorax sp. TaxID=1872122 RepID=UPI0039190BE1
MSDAQPASGAAAVLVSRLDAPYAPLTGIGVLVINYNTARQTLRCLESIQQSTVLPDWVLVLDNASSAEDFEHLRQGCRPPAGGSLQIYRSDTNLGFANGSNALIDLLLRQSACQQIMLLNNDAVAQKEMLATLSAALDAAGSGAGLAGGRMHKLANPAEVDTLGISMYASLMPADRKALDDNYIGPTGGCCMFTRALAERLKAVSGYCFDPRFFCYCEDTDMVLRALLLGYRPIFIDQLMALHEGQASSGGGYNAFIAYHGLRNALWMHIKLMPQGMFLRYGLFLLLAHMLMTARHILAGRFSLIWRVYRDALRQMPEFMAERKSLRPHLQLHYSALPSFITPRFYRAGYARMVAQEYSFFRSFFFSSKK